MQLMRAKCKKILKHQHRHCLRKMLTVKTELPIGGAWLCSYAQSGNVSWQLIKEHPSWLWVLPLCIKKKNMSHYPIYLRLGRHRMLRGACVCMLTHTHSSAPEVDIKQKLCKWKELLLISHPHKKEYEVQNDYKSL